MTWYCPSVVMSCSKVKCFRRSGRGKNTHFLIGSSVNDLSTVEETRFSEGLAADQKLL